MNKDDIVGWVTKGRISKILILFLFLKSVTQSIWYGENLEFLEFESSMECYKPVNKGRICTEALISE